MEPQPVSPQELERRRMLRLIVTGLGFAVFVAGNAAGLLGWIQWGPEQTNANQLPWILASAFGFWLSSSLLLVLLFDTWLIVKYGATPPSYKDLEGNGPIRSRANRIREMAETHHALIGAGGLVLGAVVAHLMWQP